MIYPDPVKDISALVVNAASLMVVSACYRDPDMDLWEECDDMVDDDELLPDTLESSYSCASAAAGIIEKYFFLRVNVFLLKNRIKLLKINSKVFCQKFEIWKVKQRYEK